MVDLTADSTRCDVEVDTVLGTEDQRVILQDRDRLVHGEVEVAQDHGPDDLHFVHGKVLADAVPDGTQEERMGEGEEKGAQEHLNA